MTKKKKKTKKKAKKKVAKKKVKKAPKKKKDESTYPAYSSFANPDGSYCREVPECGCGYCRDPYGGYTP